MTDGPTWRDADDPCDTDYWFRLLDRIEAIRDRGWELRRRMDDSVTLDPTTVDELDAMDRELDHLEHDCREQLEWIYAVIRDALGPDPGQQMQTMLRNFRSPGANEAQAFVTAAMSTASAAPLTFASRR